MASAREAIAEAAATTRAPAGRTAVIETQQGPEHGHPGGHEGSEGLALSAGRDRSARASAPRCVAGVRVREYAVTAIDVDITLDRYLDHDPQGRMYVLEDDVARVRAEETRNAEARAGRGDPAVTIGLQGDAIQPLVLRVDQGECLRIRFRNGLRGDAAGIVLHGGALYVAGSYRPAAASDAGALVASGREVTYEWAVAVSEPEGTHYFHSPGDDRARTGHGLFGAVIVEPQGSAHFDPRTREPLRSGWDAVIRLMDGTSFREAVIFYHEIGDELYQLQDRGGGLVPLVDPLTGAYRPGARALNYRSEPFMDRLALQLSVEGRFDESLAYSSYAFGDPATPMLRSYLGDPLKQRIVHGGSEVFHVHHVHGGAIRWRRQPGTEPSAIAAGLVKHPPLVPAASERIDSQSVGPSETYDVENECGSGGCQQSAGDYLIHCHVAEHYFAGMWTLWRVYNTRQDGAASTDTLPPLPELPNLEGRVAAAVTSDRLVGSSVSGAGAPRTIGRSDLASWVEPQLPPAGVPRGYDASVLDRVREGDRYLGEPEDPRAWPGYRSSAPGSRPPLLFDPLTGKLAYPFLRPHLGKRPPFAPGHGPAPFLDPFGDAIEPPAPGANGPASLCPAGTTVRRFAIDAVGVPVVLNRRAGVVDPAGELYVLHEDAAAVLADPTRRQPLAIRANAGEACIDVLLRNRLEDGAGAQGYSKADLHIHFVQFDVQASDGVVAGFNYEQSVRPYAVEGERISRAAEAGATRLELRSAARFQAGALVGVGMDEDATFEVARIASVDRDTLVLDRPLRNAHATGAIVSAEFVRYRWYPDVQSGTAYFHDHVNALASWAHGLFGALIVEPPGSTYHDPATGAPVRSGTIVDIHTTATVFADLTGSFREVALFIQDGVQVTRVGRSSGSALNMRAEPLSERGGDPLHAFATAEHGDPETPLVQAYLDDPVVFRLLVGATNDVHTWHVDGHWVRAEPYSATSPPISTVHLGISERYDVVIPHAGGPQHMPGDYLYMNGRAFKQMEGSWGILRVRDPSLPSALRPLPGRPPPAPAARDVCPADAPRRTATIVAVDVDLPMLQGERGRAFVPLAQADAVRSGARAAEPLVLHASLGDCVEIELRNQLAFSPVALHADGLAAPPDGAVGAGSTPRAVRPSERATYRYYAHPELGETVVLLIDRADPIRGPRLGLYGALVIAPRGAGIAGRAPDVGEMSAGAQVDVRPADAPPYRDITVFMEDEDAGIGTHRMPYTVEVEGIVGLSYGREPIHGRDITPAVVARPFGTAARDPRTPVLRARPGDAVHLHVVVPYSEQGQVFGLEGHRWPTEPGRAGTAMVSSVQVGGLEAVTLIIDGGAGPPGDYVYGDHRLPYRDAGMWGILRVEDTPSALDPGSVIGAVASLIVLATLGIWYRRRRI